MSTSEIKVTIDDAGITLEDLTIHPQHQYAVIAVLQKLIMQITNMTIEDFVINGKV